MKFLRIHQPAHPSATDYCLGIDGELAVATPLVCDRNDCGCDSTMVGLNSIQASTTVIVAEVELTMAELVAACLGFLDNTGWSGCLAEDDNPSAVHEAAEQYMRFMADVAAEFNIGEVLRPRYDRDAECWEFTPAETSGEAK